jgi:hypothetical protein
MGKGYKFQNNNAQGASSAQLPIGRHQIVAKRFEIHVEKQDRKNHVGDFDVLFDGLCCRAAAMLSLVRALFKLLDFEADALSLDRFGWMPSSAAGPEAGLLKPEPPPAVAAELPAGISEASRSAKLASYSRSLCRTVLGSI